MTETTNVEQTPAMQTPPPAPGAPAPVGQPGSQQPKQKLIIGGIIAAAVVVGLVYFMSSGKVSQEDYRDAVEVGNGIVSEASSSVSDVTRISYISSISTKDSLEDNFNDATKSLKDYESANKKLADLKALNDKDVKEKYDAYMKQYNDYVGFATTYIASAKVALLAVAQCEDLSTATAPDAATYKTAVTPCLDALEDASDVKDKDLQSFIKEYKENADKIAANVTKAAGLTSAEYLEKSKLRTEVYAFTKNISDAQRDTNDKISKRLKAVSPRDAFNAFGNLLEDKQRSS